LSEALCKASTYRKACWIKLVNTVSLLAATADLQALARELRHSTLNVDWLDGFTKTLFAEICNGFA